jgi:hypothetical protein
MKTNTQWYPYPELKVYLKLEDGDLMYCPMHADGSMDEDERGEADFTNPANEHEYEQAMEIIAELKLKP